MRGAKADSFFWQLLRMRESPCRRLYRMPAMLQEAQRRPTRKPRGREVADSLEGILGSILEAVSNRRGRGHSGALRLPFPGAGNSSDCGSAREADRRANCRDGEGHGADSTAATAEEFSEKLSQLVDRSVMIFGKRKTEWNQHCELLRESVDFWTSAAGADPKRRGKASAEARKAWAAIKSAYPQEALQLLPPLWSCPMHSELMEDAPKECPICGMSLEPIYVTQPELSQLPAIRAEIETKAPLEA